MCADRINGQKRSPEGDVDSRADRAWSITLLNEFRILREDLPVRLPGISQRLLALLALNGPMHRASVVAHLWPNSSEASARASLRNALWHISGTAPGSLVVDLGTVRLRAEVKVDLDEFYSDAWTLITTDGDGMMPCGARQLIHRFDRVELLPGWYDFWLDGPRDDLRQVRLHALESLSALLLRRHENALAIQAAMRAAHAEPLRESAAAAVISAHLAERNVGEAFRYYQAHARRLRRELGVTPSEQLRRLLPPDIKGRRLS